MGPIQSFADIVVVAIVAACVILAVRALRRGTVKSCDSGCGGSCASCDSHCAQKGLKLSSNQLHELDKLSKRFGGTSA